MRVTIDIPEDLARNLGQTLAELLKFLNLVLASVAG
jgi:hypothetical protein